MFSRLVTKPKGPAVVKPKAPAIVNDVLGSPGQPLDRTIRTYMEPRFGHDFSRVRVHSGEVAEQSARETNADAYTVGHDIVFRTGHPTFDTNAGRRLLAHELTHVVQQSRSDGIHANSSGDKRDLSSSLTVGPAGDSYEQEAHRIADQVTRMCMPSPLHRISTARRALQRQMGRGIYYADYILREFKQEYVEFVNKAVPYGLPVKFLMDVSRVTTIKPSDVNAYNATFEWLNLRPDTLAPVRDLAPTQKVIANIEIQKIYHESTHAYLYAHRNEYPIKQFYERGTRHYENAPLQQHGITSSPERVFQEACAVYVGNRAAAWWTAFSKLTKLGAGQFPQTTSMLEGIRAEYDKVMSERIVGYSDEGGWFSEEQVSTTRPITEEMKAFLDLVLLENKIPDKFDQVAVFKELFAKAMAITKGG
jgi:hypothetical protein